MPPFPLTCAALEDLLRDIRSARVAIVGDFCLDAYWFLDPAHEETSLETGLRTRAVREQRYSLGGAGNGHPGPGVLFASHHFHPLVSAIDFSCDFVPSKVALWANDRTFSCEPFHEALIAPDDHQDWSVTLDVREDAQ